MILQDRLNQFNKLQIEKFIQVEKKHPDNTVTKDDSDFWKMKGVDETQTNHVVNLIDQLEYHLVEEICEYFGMKDLAQHMMYMINTERSRIPKDLRLPDYKAKECIDISNLSFLLWCINK